MTINMYQRYNEEYAKHSKSCTLSDDYCFKMYVMKYGSRQFMVHTCMLCGTELVQEFFGTEYNGRCVEVMSLY